MKTKKDVVFDNVKILNDNQIPLTNSLDEILPLRGSLIALKTDGIHELYYGNGIQWVQITDNGIITSGPLNDVLAIGNVTSGNNIVFTDGDSIVSELDGAIRLSNSGSASLININSQGQLLLESDISDLSAIVIKCNDAGGGVDINAGSAGVDIDSVLGQISLTSTQAEPDAVQINASNGGIDINPGDDGIDVSTTGPINMTSSIISGSSVRITAANNLDNDSISIATPSVLTLANTKTSVGNLITAHISTNQSVAPTSSVGATIVAGSTDVAGGITGWDQNVNAACTVTFSAPKTVYSVIITPTNENSDQIYVFDMTPSNFTVRTSSLFPGIKAFDYIIIGYE